MVKQFTKTAIISLLFCISFSCSNNTHKLIDPNLTYKYMYQYLLYTNKTSILNGEQIKDGWLTHMLHEEENYLWVANQKALGLMLEGTYPQLLAIPKYPLIVFTTITMK